MFRTPESLNSEKISRDLVCPFLESRGFTNVKDRRTSVGNAQSQLVEATDPSGDKVKLHVRLCWRWGRGNDKYSASQLRARIDDDDRVKSLRDGVSRDASKGITHWLFVQPSRTAIAHAAMIPIRALPDIWESQRNTFEGLIANKRLGRTKKNPAMNGDSPTLWLWDTRTPAAHEATDVVWNWPGVVDLMRLSNNEGEVGPEFDDSVDDILVDFSTLGSEGAPRVTVSKSYVKRDPAVRRAVLRRASKGCERDSCGDTRSYPGFLDVHHILGAETSDRYWNCVALCPNCHREAHFSSRRDQLNAELLNFAVQFKSEEMKGHSKG